MRFRKSYRSPPFRSWNDETESGGDKSRSLYCAQDGIAVDSGDRAKEAALYSDGLAGGTVEHGRVDSL